MLVLYASWCAYCHVLMPTIVTLIQEHQLDNVSPFFISLDTQPRVLSKYLVHRDYNKVFDPYMLDAGVFDADVFGNLANVLASNGSGYQGSIPYIGFFNVDGKMVAEAFGPVGRQQLLAMASPLHH